MGDLAEMDPKEALATLEGETLTTWSDDKKKAYCTLLDQRTRVARFILVRTAQIILQTAENKRFISARHSARYARRGVEDNVYDELSPQTPNGWRYDKSAVGGRSVTSLEQIAHVRAKEVLSNLPPLQQAVRIISPDTADMIRKLEKLQADVEPVKKELDDQSRVIRLSELPQDMTIGQFRKLAHERERRCQTLVSKLNNMTHQATSLDEQINKALFAGLPGLSDAVIDTVESYYDQALALEQAMRRIEEQVKYGDSEAALSVLRQFEQDEAVISSNVAARFKDALDKLKLSVEKGRKRRTKVAEIAT